MSNQKLLVPLDGSEFGRKILPHIRSICSPDTFEVVLLQVTDPQTGVRTRSKRPNTEGTISWGLNYDMPTYTPPTGPNFAVYQSQAEDSLQLKLMSEMLQDAVLLEEAGFSVTREIRFGDPAGGIVDFVEQEGISLVAMATHGRTGLPRLLMGSVAETVLRKLTVPVLLVHAIDVAARELS